MCTPTESGNAHSWWQIRTNDSLAAYPGASLIVGSESIETLAGGSQLVREELRAPSPRSVTIELWFLDWGPVSQPYKPVYANDSESPSDNPYRHSSASLNDKLKQGMVKDCFADVIIYAGKNGDPIRSDTQIALCSFFGGSLNRETGCKGASMSRSTMLISESLGSSILSDAFRSLKFSYIQAAHDAAVSTTLSLREIRRHAKDKTANPTGAEAEARLNSHDMTAAMTSMTNFRFVGASTQIGNYAGWKISSVTLAPTNRKFIASLQECSAAGALREAHLTPHRSHSSLLPSAYRWRDCNEQVRRVRDQ